MHRILGSCLLCFLLQSSALYGATKDWLEKRIVGWTLLGSRSPEGDGQGGERLDDGEGLETQNKWLELAGRMADRETPSDAGGGTRRRLPTNLFHNHVTTSPNRKSLQGVAVHLQWEGLRGPTSSSCSSVWRPDSSGAVTQEKIRREGEMIELSVCGPIKLNPTSKSMDKMYTDTQTYVNFPGGTSNQSIQ